MDEGAFLEDTPFEEPVPSPRVDATGDLSWTTQTPLPPRTRLDPPPLRPARPTPMRRTPALARRPDLELRARLDDSWSRSTSWPGMTDEQRRVAVTRATIEVLARAERNDALADGIVHALSMVPRVGLGRAQFLQEVLVAKLPRRSLLGACALLARWTPEVADLEGVAAEPWLDVVARLLESVAVVAVQPLDDAGIELLRALEEDGALLARRMADEIKATIRAGRYLRVDPGQARAATAALDAAGEPADYAVEAGAAERAVVLLATAAKWTSAAPVVTVLALHATTPEPFAGRAALAAAALDRIYVPAVIAPIVRALAEGSADEAALLRILEAGGPRVVEATVRIMRQTPAVAVRRAAGVLLRAHPAHARAHALHLLAQGDGAPALRRTVYEVLGSVGEPEDAQLVARDCDHPSEEVRCAVLWAAAAIIRERAHGLLVRAIDDPSPVVQVRAVNLLGQLRLTQRDVLDRLARIVEDPSPPEDAEGLLEAAAWALGHIGNVPLPGRGANVEGLLVSVAGRARPAGLRRVLGSGNAEAWWRPPVRVALCRALAAVGTDRARAALLAIGDSVDDPARDEARRLLAQHKG